MRIVFMGSAALACRPLEGLVADADAEVVGVVTQPDRPKGRRLRPAPCDLKRRALDLGLVPFTPVRVNEPESVAGIRALAPDLIVVVAYGQILKPRVLEIPPLGCVNVHASLLPKYRGAAPIQWAIARGETVTGVTTMFMNERMDAGDIILQREVAIDDGDTAGTLHDRLAEEGATCLGQTVAALRKGRVERTPQDTAEVTFAPKLSRADGRIDWEMPAVDIHNRVRGFNPWPCCHCVAPGPHGAPGSLRVLRTRVEPRGGTPGSVLDTSGDGPLVGTGAEALRLLEVQPAGGKAMGGAAYLRGHDVGVGDELK